MAIAKTKLTAQDKIWRVEEDARILAEAGEIVKDKVRLSGARKQAKIMAKDQEKKLKLIKKVAGVKPKK